jgi:hypothetical protein
MENTNHKKTILKVLQQIQRDTFHTDVTQNDLMTLYAKPTSIVNFFYNKIEATFEVKFEERPTTLDEMADIIMEQENKNNWKFESKEK